MIHSSIFD
ncbi:hypothetical protein D043_5189A, partial [Vibrio parahaemolyticus EKP-021]